LLPLFEGREEVMVELLEETTPPDFVLSSFFSVGVSVIFFTVPPGWLTRIESIPSSLCSAMDPT